MHSNTLRKNMPKLTWTDIVKKYGMVNGPRYYDSGTIPKLIKNAQGSVIAQIDKWDKNEFQVEVMKLGTNKHADKRFDSLEKLDAYLAKLNITVVLPKATDEQIIKFLRRTYMTYIKDVADLKEGWSFVKWPDAIEMKDSQYQACYCTLINGTVSTGEEEGLGELGMTVVEFQTWLLAKGVRKAKKPKRNFGMSLYD